MKISVLIAITLPSPTLGEALAGVAAQTHADWELVVADSVPGGASDAVLRGFAEQHPVRVESVEPSAGVAVVRNRLLDAAGGDAVAFLEPQDAWMPRHLATAVQHLTAGADVVVSSARLQETDTDRALGEVSPTAQLASATVRALFSRDVIPSLSCVAARRGITTTAGRFDPRFRDTRDFWLRCALAGAKFELTDRATCRVRRSRTVSGERALQNADQAVLFYEKHRDLAAVPAALRRRLLAGSLVAQGRLLRAIDPARAARCFWRAWSLQPVHVQTLGQYALTEWRSAKPTEPQDVG